MYILDIIPIQKGFPLEVLSYFSARELPIGTCVTIPLQKRFIPGLVVERRDARTLKISLKQQPFSLRNVHEILPYTFPEPLMRAIARCAKYYSTPVQDILAFIFSEHWYTEKKFPDCDHPTLRSEKHALQVSRTERMGWYRTYARQLLSEKKSLHIICPTIESCQRLAASITRGIERNILVLHSGIGKMKRKKTIESYLGGEKTSILISTPSFLGLFRANTSTYIIEEESSEHYRNSWKPTIDLRFLIEEIAGARGATIIRADCLLSLETHQKIKDGDYSTTLPIRFHAELKGSVTFFRSAS